jgi:hypothetical protein
MNACLCYILSCFLTFAAHLHPVHVSILNAEYTTKGKSIDLSFKVFTSDLELAIYHNYAAALNLGKPNENPDASKFIDKYLSGAFSLTINNNNQPKLVYTRKAINEDAIWLYYHVPINDKVKSLKIRNLVLLDIYADQTNLLILAIDGKEKGYRFTINQPEETINI